jgi:hypothetical protein
VSSPTLHNPVSCTISWHCRTHNPVAGVSRATPATVPGESPPPLRSLNFRNHAAAKQQPGIPALGDKGKGEPPLHPCDPSISATTPLQNNNQGSRRWVTKGRVSPHHTPAIPQMPKPCPPEESGEGAKVKGGVSHPGQQSSGPHQTPQPTPHGTTPRWDRQSGVRGADSPPPSPPPVESGARDRNGVSHLATEQLSPK